jgi:hypothetical protein
MWQSAAYGDSPDIFTHRRSARCGIVEVREPVRLAGPDEEDRKALMLALLGQRGTVSQIEAGQWL